jgi:hypothetical protein
MHNFQGVVYCVVLYADSGHFRGSFETVYEGSDAFQPQLLQVIAREYGVHVADVIPVAIQSSVNTGFQKKKDFTSKAVKGLLSNVTTAACNVTLSSGVKETRVFAYMQSAGVLAPGLCLQNAETASIATHIFDNIKTQVDCVG